MTVLKDYQFEILPDAEATDGFVFGIGAEVSLNDGGFDPGENEWLSQDQQNTRRGVTAFGRDVIGSKTWLWESHTDQQDAESAVAVLEDMSAAWMPEMAREPGWVTSVRYKLAGRTRRVFGRPRRYAAPPTNLILGGLVPVTHDFQCVDSYTYDDLATQARIDYVSTADAGGWKFPVKFPISTVSGAGSGVMQVDVGGNAKAYPVVRFYGPWSDPSLDAGEWSLKWRGSVPEGGFLEIDCRPWKLTVTDQDGASQVGALDKRSWIEDAWFAPKSRTLLTFGGSAPSGTAYATVTWRNTWTSI